MSNEPKITKKALLKAFFFEQKLPIISVFIFGIISNLLTIFIPVSIGKYYELLFDIHSKRAAVLSFLPASWTNEMSNFLILFNVAVCLKITFNFLQRYYTAKMSELFIKNLREKLYKKQLLIDMEVYDEKGIGRYLLRFSGDLNSIKKYIANGIIRFSIDATLILLALIALFSIHHLIALMLIGGLILIILSLYFLNKLLYQRSLTLRNSKSGLLAFVNRSLLSIKTIKSFYLYRIFSKRYNKRSQKVYRHSLVYHRINTLISVLINGMLYFLLAGVFYFIYFLKSKSITIDMQHLLAFVLLFITLLPVVRRILKAPSIWKIGNLSFYKLIRIFNLKEESGIQPNIKAKSIDLTKCNQSITFKNVTCFRDDTNAATTLNNLSFSLQTNKNYLLLNTGKGWRKDIILDLLVQLTFPHKGKIYLCQTPYEKIPVSTIRNTIKIISELYPVSGRNVLQAIVPHINEKTKNQAQKLLQFMLQDVPEKYHLHLNQIITEQGANLPQYQQQLIVYLRAFIYEQTQILVIDDFSKIKSSPYFTNIVQYLRKIEKSKNVQLIFLDDEKPTPDFFDEIITI